MAPPPGFPATPLENFSSPKEQFSENNYILREIASGSFGTVFVTIPKDDADKIIAKHPSSSNEVSTELLTDLRRNLRATKISKALDMSEEIAFLSSLQRIACAGVKNVSRNLPLLFTAENLESNNTSLWMTIELLEGGTLHKFYDFQLQQEQLDRPALPVSLLWHWLAQMAHTFMYLHLGRLPDGSIDDDFIPLVHNDMHWGNIMIRPPKTTEHNDDFRDYPDLVLSDFGNAMTWDSDKSFVNRKEKDILDFQMEFEQFFEHVDGADVNLENFFKKSVRFRCSRGTNDDADMEERKFLKRLIKVAERKKRELYQPLAKELREYFERPMVTDKELEEFVVKVRKDKGIGSRSDSAIGGMDDEKTAGCGCKTM